VETEHDAALGAGQQKLRLGGGGQRAQKQQTGDDGANLLVHRGPALIVQLAQGHVQSPLIAAQVAETIGRQIDGFADAHPGQARQQRGVRKQIVAAAQFQQQAGIVLGGQRPGQELIGAWDILAEQQSGARRKAMIPQQVEKLAQADQVPGAGMLA